MRFLSIDPSVNNVGWALYDSKENEWYWGFWKIEGRNREMRLLDIVHHIIEEVGKFDHLVIEYPTFFASAAGQVAAHKSYTIDLAAICGYVAGWFKKDHRTYHPITAIGWKGAVKKEITIRKFCRIMGIKSTTLTDHTIDAIMLLRYFILTYGLNLFQLAGEDFPESRILRL